MGLRHRSLIGEVGLLCGIGAMLLIALMIENQLRHWFVIPVMLCAVLIIRDLMAWIEGRRDLFDPIGIFAVIGLNFFVIAPVLHVMTGYYMRTPFSPEDWRAPIGFMAWLNAFGLLLLRLGLRTTFSEPGASSAQQFRWTFPEQMDVRWHFGLALFITALVQVAVYAAYGGIGGYMGAFDEQIVAAGGGPFAGMGWIFMISESFPILAMMVYALWQRQTGKVPSWLVLAVVLLVYLLLKLLFGGLRGSRSNTIWGLFWAVGIIHLWIRPVSRSIAVAGLVFVIGFMYAYGFYKAVGTEAVHVFTDEQVRRDVEADSGRAIDTVLLGDLARTDVQAFIAYTQVRHPTEYQYAWGRTYLGAFAVLIPAGLWPNRPPTKVREGSLILYRDWHPEQGPTRLQSSRIYGLSGEGMLNFGPGAVPVLFLLYGAMLGALSRLMHGLAADDVRRLFVPMLVLMAIIGFISDLDNVVFFVIKNGAVPILVLLFTARREPLQLPAGS